MKRYLIWGACFTFFAAKAQTPLDTNFRTVRPLVAQGLRFTPLFSEGESVERPAGGTAPSKGKFDFMAYLPQTPGRALLWVNHETLEADDGLGDGGGATTLSLAKTASGYQRMGAPRAIDFSSVGGTYYNCLGAPTPWGTVLTSEESDPLSNAQIFRNGKGVRDTSDFGGYPRYQNYGWMVEVEPESGKVLGKRWGMGRCMHEGALCMPDQKTVYLLDDFAQGIFFKLVADRPKDLTKGKLFAYNLEKRAWIPLSMERDSLNYTRDMALRRGATIFIRLEDIDVAPDGTFFLTETGTDSVDLSKAIQAGGKVAPHLARWRQDNNSYKDVHGRILTFNPQNDEMKVWLEGGAGNKTTNVLSNPDNLSIDRKRNRLIIHEDINAANKGRVPKYAEGRLMNEIYYIDLNKKAPTVDDLTRFFIAPAGSESTGGTWSPDFETYFVNIQHPDPQNPAPYNKDVTLSIEGWAK